MNCSLRDPIEGEKSDTPFLTTLRGIAAAKGCPQRPEPYMSPSTGSSVPAVPSLVGRPQWLGLQHFSGVLRRPVPALRHNAPSSSARLLSTPTGFWVENPQSTRHGRGYLRGPKHRSVSFLEYLKHIWYTTRFVCLRVFVIVNQVRPTRGTPARTGWPSSRRGW